MHCCFWSVQLFAGASSSASAGVTAVGKHWPVAAGDAEAGGVATATTGMDSPAAAIAAKVSLDTKVDLIFSSPFPRFGVRRRLADGAPDNQGLWAPSFATFGGRGSGCACIRVVHW
jgi:hypothetical protein